MNMTSNWTFLQRMNMNQMCLVWCLSHVRIGGNREIFRLSNNSVDRYTHWRRVGRTCLGDSNHVHLKSMLRQAYKCWGVYDTDHKTYLTSGAWLELNGWRLGTTQYDRWDLYCTLCKWTRGRQIYKQDMNSETVLAGERIVLVPYKKEHVPR